MENHFQVLVVDAAAETRDVLRTALERRGLRTLTASRGPEGLALAQRHRPELIVLDMDVEGDAQAEIAAEFAKQSPRGRASLVILGTVRRGQTLPQSEYVSKPYHYAPLIRRIEAILSARSARVGGQVDNPLAE